MRLSERVDNHCNRFLPPQEAPENEKKEKYTALFPRNADNQNTGKTLSRTLRA
jgi:hypothetical protein